MRGTLHLPVEVARDLRAIIDNTAVHANDRMIDDQYCSLSTRCLFDSPNSSHCGSLNDISVANTIGFASLFDHTARQISIEGRFHPLVWMIASVAQKRACRAELSGESGASC